MKYLANIPQVFKQRAVYRGDFFAGLFGQMVRIAIYYSLWNVVGASIDGVSPAELTTYSVLALILVRSIDSSIGHFIGDAIKDGSISIHFLRPVDFQLSLLARAAGESAFGLFYNGAPLFIIASLVFPVQPPASFAHAVLFLLSLLVAIFMGASLSFLFGMATFWTYNSWGLSVFRQLMVNAFSGALAPVILFPNWLLLVSKWLPFQYMVNQPVSAYLGWVAPADALLGIAIQILWGLILLLAGRWISMKAVSNLVIQGG